MSTADGIDVLPRWAAAALAGQCASRVLPVCGWHSCLESSQQKTLTEVAACLETWPDLGAVDSVVLNRGMVAVEHWLIDSYGWSMRSAAQCMKYALAAAEAAQAHDGQAGRLAGLTFECALQSVRSQGDTSYFPWDQAEAIERRIKHCLGLLLAASDLEAWADDVTVASAFFGLPAYLDRPMPDCREVSLHLRGPGKMGDGEWAEIMSQLIRLTGELARSYGINGVDFQVAGEWYEQPPQAAASAESEAARCVSLDVKVCEDYDRYTLPSIVLALRTGILKAEGSSNPAGRVPSSARRKGDKGRLALVTDGLRQHQRRRVDQTGEDFFNCVMAAPDEICTRRLSLIEYLCAIARRGVEVTLKAMDWGRPGGAKQ